MAAPAMRNCLCLALAALLLLAAPAAARMLADKTLTPPIACTVGRQVSAANAIATAMPLYTQVLTASSGANVADVLNAIYSTDSVSIGTIGLGPELEVKDVNTSITLFNEYRLAVPDIKWVPQQIIASHNTTHPLETLVAVRSMGSGHPVGSFLGVDGLNGTKAFLCDTFDIHEVRCIKGLVKIFRIHHVEAWLTAVQELTA